MCHACHLKGLGRHLQRSTCGHDIVHNGNALSRQIKVATESATNVLAPRLRIEFRLRDGRPDAHYTAGLHPTAEHSGKRPCDFHRLVEAAFGKTLAV